ncbi:hypothetical protein LX32DRAFT_339408 [Colletotrichum zoysiae]|uniref:Uncharacterized protein n=1 Tax=Colletotrichum zoysiae TaxID=1216348 RepID=A0AAD9HVJ6_9PEZI|nr:hypothetical protein LX32DRAFT_339408 [Colletotrichum zoysiae]
MCKRSSPVVVGSPESSQPGDGDIRSEQCHWWQCCCAALRWTEHISHSTLGFATRLTSSIPPAFASPRRLWLSGLGGKSTCVERRYVLETLQQILTFPWGTSLDFYFFLLHLQPTYPVRISKSFSPCSTGSTVRSGTTTAHVKATRLIFSRLPVWPDITIIKVFLEVPVEAGRARHSKLVSGSLAFRTIRIAPICHGVPDSSLNHSDAVAVTSHVRVRLGLCPPLVLAYPPVLPSTGCMAVGARIGGKPTGRGGPGCQACRPLSLALTV